MHDFVLLYLARCAYQDSDLYLVQQLRIDPLFVICFGESGRMEYNLLNDVMHRGKK